MSSPPPVPRQSLLRSRAARRIVALAVVSAVLLTACAGDQGAGDQDAADHAAVDRTTTHAGGGGHLDLEVVGPVEDGEAAPAERSDAETDESVGGAGAEGAGAEGPDVDAAGVDLPPAVLAAAGRERIRNAWITLEFDDPEAAVPAVTAAVEERGGFVALADLVRDTGTGELEGSLTVRVPSAELQPTLEAFEELAEAAPVRRIEEEEVGAELTDLRAQETNLTAYEGELRELLAVVREASSDPDDLLPVVQRLQSVRSDVDRLRARRVDLEDRVAFSTVTVTLAPTTAGAPIAASAWAPARTLQESLAATGRALGRVADTAIWIGVTGVPVAAVVLGPPAAAWWWLQRRRDGVRPSTPPPPAA